MQRFALETAPLDTGTVLLEASAGTGKTYTLVGILLRLLLERRIERLDQALVVTFTNAATEELKNRVRRALGAVLEASRGRPSDPFFTRLAALPDAARLARAALDQFDQVAIATIHGFCKRLLDAAAFESHQPFRIDFAEDPLPLLHRAAADVLRGQYTAAAEARSAVLYEHEVTPARLVAWYRLWRRYPDVRIVPAPADPDPHLAELDRAVAAAAALADADVLRRLEGLGWYANKSPIEEPAALDLARCLERLRSTPMLALDKLTAFAPSELAKRVSTRGPQPFEHPFVAACEPVAAARRRAFPHLRAALLQRMHERLEDEKRRAHVMTFDDLLARTHAALHDPGRGAALLQAIRSRHAVALIDEFQDTDALQYEIFSRCFANRPLFLIGDPKQSIYGFRGADLQAYLAASADAAVKATLDRNFRSSDGLVRAVSLLFVRRDAFVETAIRLLPVQAAAPAGDLLITGDPGAPFCWRLLSPGQPTVNKGDAEPRIARDVAAEISRLLRVGARLDDRPLQPRDIAVLTRTNRQAVLVQDELREAGIVAAIGKAGDIWETDELEEVQRMLGAVLQPNDLGRARAAMTTRLWGLSAAAIAALDLDDAAFDQQIERLEAWRSAWLRRGVVVMQERMLGDLQVERRLLGERGGERRLTNVQQIFELLHSAEQEHRLSPEGLLEWLQHERTHHGEIDYQLRELRLESDEDAVQIGTVHGAKGLQYEIVFCPFLWDTKLTKDIGVTPDAPGRVLQFSLLKSDPAWPIAEEQRLAEDVRLCYVALTRAKRRCYVHWGAMGASASSALAWLLQPQSPDRSGERWIDRWFDQQKRDLAAYERNVRVFQRSAEGTMDVALVPEHPEPVPVPPAAAERLEDPPPPPQPVRARALHSFSSLVAGALAPAEGRAVHDEPQRQAPKPATEPPSGIFAFARGAAAGTCLHTILEHEDLNRLDAKTAGRVRSALAAAGLADPAAHHGEIDPVAVVVQNLADVAAARAHAGGPTLAQLCGGARLAEWQFVLPAERSDFAALAGLLAESGSAPAVAQAARLQHLPHRTLRGFLTGFVDLIAEYDGRYWVLDWKSNHLGNRPLDYGPDALAAAMCEHDYALQYHLYVLALHRHLQSRMPGYDGPRHLGGVCYVFLRGAVPGTTNGVFYDRVPGELVLAMDRWAAGELGGRR